MTSPSSLPITPQDADLFCPVCGYNVRGTTSEQCPECGLALDRSKLSQSIIPWTHRRQIGRIRAYFKTVWMVLRRPTLVGREVAKPQNWADAVRFRRVTTALLFLTFGAAAVAQLRVTDFQKLLSEFNPMGSLLGYGMVQPGASVDLGILQLVGWQMWIMIPIYIWALAAATTSLAGCWFAPSRLSTEQQNRARAISHYSAAPLALLPVLILAAVGSIWLGGLWGWTSAPFAAQSPTLISVALVGECVLAILLLAWWICTAKIYRAATHSSGLNQIGVAMGMFAGWIAAIAATLWLLPSVVAFFRLLIASLR